MSYIIYIYFLKGHSITFGGYNFYIFIVILLCIIHSIRDSRNKNDTAYKTCIQDRKIR